MLFAPFQHNSAISRHGLGRIAIISAVLLTFWILMAAQASAETRTLRMYFTHTKESATITFKKNGRYVKSGLRKANRFLRDWRRKEPTRMDPQLLDLVWEVYQKSGSRKPIHVISGYRSPRTNSMLRRRGRKVARTSQHMKGKALDFFIPGVSVKKLRALGLKAHRGGVGYYRGSFVHLDTGNVRHWPRMSRRQLARVFPRGKTIHVPSNGKPLRGYKVAMANLKRGRNANGSRRKTKIRGGTSFFARLRSRGRGGDEDETIAVAAKSAPKLKPKKQPKPIVVAKAETPKPKPAPKLKRKNGADPFALEAKVADKASEAETDETELVASLDPSQLTVPVRRPRTTVAQESEIVSSEVALASPPATVGVLRPAVEIPTPSVSPSAILTNAQAPQQTAELREQVATALTRQRSNTIAQTAANAIIVRRPQVPVPQATIQTALLEPSIKPSSANLLDERLGPKAMALGSTSPSKPLDAPVLASLPARVEVPLPAVAKPAKLDEAAVLAALQRHNSTAKTTNSLNADSATSVPIPRPVISGDSQIAKSEVIASPGTEMKSELALGNLDGYSVKVWAVAATTRIGTIAKLTPPAYGKSVEREAPARVLGDGFTNKRPYIRADRFTGRALTRVAFAKLASL